MAPTADGDKKVKPMVKKQIAHFEKRLLEERKRVLKELGHYDETFGSTPQGAWTTTSPNGKVQQGKTQHRKNLTAIAVAHDIPYVAQASPHNFRDLQAKAERAFETPGPAFLNVISPCPRGWRSDPKDAIEHARMMVQSCFWPLYEVIDGQYVINFDPKNRKIPVVDWMKLQGRFSHLFKAGNEHILVEFQDSVDREWNRIKAMASLGGDTAGAGE